MSFCDSFGGRMHFVCFDFLLLFRGKFVLKIWTRLTLTFVPFGPGHRHCLPCCLITELDHPWPNMMHQSKPELSKGNFNLNPGHLSVKGSIVRCFVAKALDQDNAQHVIPGAWEAKQNENMNKVQPNTEQIENTTILYNWFKLIVQSLRNHRSWWRWWASVFQCSRVCVIDRDEWLAPLLTLGPVSGKFFWTFRIVIIITVRLLRLYTAIIVVVVAAQKCALFSRRRWKWKRIQVHPSLSPLRSTMFPMMMMSKKQRPRQLTGQWCTPRKNATTDWLTREHKCSQKKQLIDSSSNRVSASKTVFAR